MKNKKSLGKSFNNKNRHLQLSLRNLTRQKRRNAILAIAIAFGFFVVTAIDGLTTGMVGNLEDMITQMTGGTVLVSGYEKIPPEFEGGKSKLINIVRDRNYVRNLVENSDIDYKYFSCYTMSMGQFLFNGKKSMSSIYGRDFDEKEFLDSFRIIKGGGEKLKAPDALIISDKMAENMNLEIGDQVIFTCMTIYGQNNVADFTVAAITKSNSLMSGMQVYTHIDTLNQIIGIPEGGYSTFSIYLKDKNKQLKTALQLEKMIADGGQLCSTREEAVRISPKNIDRGIDKQFTQEEIQWEGVKYGVECLNDAVPAIKTVMNVVHTITTVILIVILLIVMIGVSNTYRMVLYERIREIGTMRALGMTGKDTGKVFTTEALILCLLGAVAGLLFAVIVMGIIHLIPISNESLQFFLHNGHFSFTLSPVTIVIQYVLLIILTSFAVHGSAKKAAGMNPAEALRTVK